MNVLRDAKKLEKDVDGTVAGLFSDEQMELFGFIFRKKMKNLLAVKELFLYLCRKTTDAADSAKLKIEENENTDLQISVGRNGKRVLASGRIRYKILFPKHRRRMAT